MAFSWIFDRKKNQFITQVAELPFHMVVYAQEGHNNTVVITCYSEGAGKTGNLTYANSIMSAKIQAEELIETGRWVEFAPEFQTQQVQPKVIARRVPSPPMPKKKEKNVAPPEHLQKLVDHFRKG